MRLLLSVAMVGSGRSPPPAHAPGRTFRDFDVRPKMTVSVVASGAS